METLYQILALVGVALIVWVVYRNIKGRPEQFSRDKLAKSFSTMGGLALLLIVFVTILVYLARM
jgi:hypothetical protein